ncbi:hypothetical protein NP493_118g03021 [Ridgeia piscesae]|uniref:CID domain-containing protein n=1 Tax=Ridgeia piscesae TaxID=27915 RepID=A0AAD9P6J0_RIDPI|nr:hypothetical protein NP493_118g03021 [Ridgeia piscesae]
MTSFSESNFAKKLDDLNNSQQSIQTLSLWLIHHRRHSKAIVDIWVKSLQKAKPEKKLTYFYLANDVIQNSRKKGPEFNRDFRTVLPKAYRIAANEVDIKTRGSMGRMLGIWKERNIFDAEFVNKLKKCFVADSSPKPEPVRKKKKVELTLREEIEKERNHVAGDPPEAEDLVKALQDLDNSASCDAAVRERIAALPPEVSDVSLLDKIKDKDAVNELMATVDEACLLLGDYNGRLAAELDERKRVAKMLFDYIVAQKESLNVAQNRLMEHKQKLEKVAGVRNELKSHIQSLPDLSLLPDVTGGLAPLPSAGDLFATEKDQ